MRKTAHFTSAHDPKTLTVRDVMEDAIVTVSPQAKGYTIARLMADGDVGSVPVVEEDLTLVGLVGEFDLLRVMDEGKDLGELTATDIMTRDVVTVTEEMLVTDVVHLLQSRHLIRVPVVNGNSLIGIVARRDIVFAYVRAKAIYWP
ncbi:MAG: CBS domain-containing protein [Nitrospira sp.]|nr:CBS domain-containing protein [Nitrospira sp.]